MTVALTRSRSLLTALAGTALMLSACGGEESADPPAEDSANNAGTSEEAASCTPEDLATVTDGTLTLSTSEPAFGPWVIDDDPTSGEGFESAVAYAVAEELGYAEGDVTWVRNTFDSSVAPGPKDFDLAINQFSITPERRNAVDFTSGYYDVRQAVITTADTDAADAKSLEDLKDVTLGAQVGTTSLKSIEEDVQPNEQPLVFNSNEDAKVALESGQVEALAVDLPTAFFLTAAEFDDGVIVGQLPADEENAEQLAFVLDLGSPLTDCATQAVDALREDGTLDSLAQEWLADVAGAPELK